VIIPFASQEQKQREPRLSEFWIPQPLAIDEIKLVVKRPEVKLITEVVGDRTVGEVIDASTDHAWLVVLGHFAQALGVVKDLSQVHLKQRKGTDELPPQTKLIEFLVGILGGIEYLQELNLGAEPIAADPTVVEAWGQKSFRHYSQVSRTLEVTDEQTLAEVVEVLQTISRPFMQQAVMETLKRHGQLMLDVDLTGRPVSPTSTDYPDADFGWMDDDVRKGYQAAVTSLVCEPWGRLLLTLQRYAGRTLSADCLQAAIRQVEQVLEVRPRRRVELVQERRQTWLTGLVQVQAKLTANQQHQDQLWQALRQAKTEAQQLQTEVSRLADDQNDPGSGRPYSQAAKCQRRLVAAQKRQSRAWRDLTKLQARADRLQQRLNQEQEQLLALDEWLAYLETDNTANPNPVSLVVRLDAGFSTGPNLTWLIEMGYIILTKVHHQASTDSLRRRLLAHPDWRRVGKNAEAVAVADYQQHDCPYALAAMLVRYHLPGKVRYTALLYYAETPPPALPDWFKAYNARQTIEAGIKEEKGVFTLKRHLIRSPIGMQLQEQFALFGANLVRWAVAWVKNLLCQANQNFQTALAEVKTLVRVVSRARGRWVRHSVGSTLIFDEAGPFAGTVISLSGFVAVQLPLRLFNFVPLSNFSPPVAQPLG
jgi:tetratricopeptide (TPR) repeat protein